MVGWAADDIPWATVTGRFLPAFMPSCEEKFPPSAPCGAKLALPPGECHGLLNTETNVDILLIIAVIVILIALLGFTGVVAALKAAAWLILVIGIVILVLALIF